VVGMPLLEKYDPAVVETREALRQIESVARDRSEVLKSTPSAPVSCPG
jgi:hypothetical protein